MIRGLFNKSIKTSVTPKKLCNKSNTSLIKQQHRNYHVSTVTRNNNASAVVNNNGNVEKDKGLVTAGVVNATASSPRSVIIRLLENIGSKKEVDQYLKYYSSIDTPRFAVIKVGGGCLMGAELETLANSLSFLADVGLIPVVLHGAGPQLNDELRSQGIESDYHGGMRVTTGSILKVARQVFLRENGKLTRALEERGTRSRPIVSGVFEAEYLDKEKMKFVGQVTKVNVDQVYQALEMGQVPILTCMGETVDGQILNINADVAGQELAKALKPVKVVYISAKGGLYDQNNKLIPVIDLDLDYPTLMQESWFKYGDRLKLKEIKTLLDELPLSSSVAITDSQNLPKELFTHKGSGTLVRRSEKINVLTSFDSVDMPRLQELIEHSFQGALTEHYLENLAPNIFRVYLSENYRAVAIITKDPNDPNATPYLDKFAVSKLSQGEGTAQQLWSHIERDHASLYWRSRNTNFINSWYFERATGSLSVDPWIVFWYGLDSLKTAETLVNKAVARPMTIDRSKPPKQRVIDFSKNGPLTADPVPFKAGNTMQSRSFSTVSKSQQKRLFSTKSYTTITTRIGLIGARGFTGSELVKLIAAHDKLTITCVSSRQLKGKSVNDVFFTPTTKNEKFGNVQFSDLQPTDLPNVKDVDIWILALPNDLAAPYVAAIDNAPNCKHVKMIDLSADYRFNDTWAYGLPERHGQRQLLSVSSRVSNPGCYATGSQISLLPLLSNNLIDEQYTPTIFGVSGFSGAGTTPSRKNDLNALKDNLMPYSLQNHMHEREISYQLSRTVGHTHTHKLQHGVRFMPHVAPWFRGISLTVAVTLKKKIDKKNIYDLYRDYYKNEAFVVVNEEIPEVAANANKNHACVGGVSVDDRRLVVCATIDNLLKGAASQCVQNINVMQGYKETDGLL